MRVEDIINRDELNERLDGDFDLFTELVDMFIKDSKTILLEIEEAIKSKNFIKIGKAAHTLKGSVSNFSASKAYTAALALEMIGKNNELDKAEDTFQILKKEIDLTIDAMKMIISEKKL